MLDMNMAANHQSLLRKLEDRTHGQCGVSKFKEVLRDNERYEVTPFSVTTNDGYVLQTFRVRLVESERNKLPAN